MMDSEIRFKILHELAEQQGITFMQAAKLMQTPLYPKELLDSFAMSAMQGMLSAQPGLEYNIAIIVRLSYKIAEAMITEKLAKRGCVE